MNPDAKKLWRGPRWALAVLLAVLGMLGPFSIDTYLPAFAGIAQSERKYLHDITKFIQINILAQSLDVV